MLNVNIGIFLFFKKVDMKYKNVVKTLVLALLMVFSACNGGSRDSVDLSKTSIKPVKITRYEKALFNLSTENLKLELKKIAPDFPVFLNADLDDTLNLIQLHDFITNPLNEGLYDSVILTYPDLTRFENELTDAFRRFNYFFPDNELPNVFSYVSGLIFEQPIQFISGDMIIALDMYLGKDLVEYRRIGLPLYKTERMNSDFITRDCMYDMYFYHFLKKPGNNVLEKMIEEGKQLYFLDVMLPKTEDFIKIGYHEAKLEWCKNNESNLWAFLIENELLYSSDNNILRKFFTDGPFSHSFSNDSPARLGEWLGWQIVRSYMMNNPKITPGQLFLEQDSEKILKQSKYKPRK